MIATGPDLLRLLVLPVFAWAAWRDVRTRRLPNRLWPPLVGLGLLLLVWEAVQLWPGTTFGARLFLTQVGASLVLLVPLSYGFWWIGAFGGADAKALIAIAVLLPTFPRYAVAGTVLPLAETYSGVFSLTVLTNAVLLTLGVPFVLAVGNLARGRIESWAMFLARPVAVDSLPDRHGRLFETPDGITRRGLDLDALRMYLRWRGTTLAALRADPAAHRDPSSIGETADPTDGATHVGPRTDGGEDGTIGTDTAADAAVDDAGDAEAATDGSHVGDAGGADEATDGSRVDDDPTTADPWGAERFLDDIEGSAYGSTPEGLRAALEVVSHPDRETVWVSPGLPFVVPMFAGLLVAFTYGDLLFGLFGWLGVV